MSRRILVIALGVVLVTLGTDARAQTRAASSAATSAASNLATGPSNPPGDQPPNVNAGADDTCTEDVACQLNTACSDDGLPLDPGTTLCTLTETDGDGNCSLSGDPTDYACNASAGDLTATCDTAGVVMTIQKCCDDDGAGTGDDPVCDTVDLTIQAAGAGTDFTLSRTACEAPCAVAAKIVDGADWRSRDYVWDFDDPTCDDFTTTGTHACNSDRGPLVGHTFEEPGTYTVELTSASGTATHDVVVSDPDTVYATTDTICVSTSGTFTSCPAGATQVTEDLLQDLESAGRFASDRRILFRRGETFDAGTAPVELHVTGIQIGAYGTGDRPIIEGSSGPIFEVGEDSASEDVTFYDLDIRGVVADANVVAVDSGGFVTDLTLFRVRVQDPRNALLNDLNTYQSNLSAHIPDGLHIHECELADSEEYTWYASGENFTVVGTTITRASPGESMVRNPWTQGLAILHSDLGPGAASAAHILYLTTPDQSDTGVIYEGECSEDLHVAYNTVTADVGPSWTNHIAPPNVSTDGCWRRLAYRGNYHGGSTSVQYGLHVGGDVQEGVIAENMFRGTRSGTDGAVRIDSAGVGALCPTDLILEHNTQWAATGGRFMQFDCGTGIEAWNNCCVGPTAVFKSGAGTLAEDQNNTLTTIAAVDFDPDDTPTTDPATWRIQATSSCADQGDASYAGTPDLFGTSRANPPDNGIAEVGSEPGGGNDPPSVALANGSCTEDVACAMIATVSDADADPLVCTYSEADGDGTCTFEDIGGGAGICEDSTDCDLDATCDTGSVTMTVSLCCDDGVNDPVCDTGDYTVAEPADPTDELQAALEAIFPTEIEGLWIGEDATTSSWPDRSGNGNDLPACTGVPVPGTGGQGGRDFVSFNGTDDCYELTSGVAGMPDTQPYSVLAVWEINDSALARVAFDCVNTSSGDIKPRIHSTDAFRWQTRTDGDTGDQEIDTSTTITDGIATYMGWMSTGGDGSQICVEMNEAGQACGNTASVTLRTGPIQACYMGVRAPTKSQWWNGDIYFTMVVRTTDEADLRLALEEIKTYYGL